MIRSKILLDSINIFGNRLTTVIAEHPRHILAEINTHKMLSKNSASSRAIPSEKMLQKVKEDPFIPIKWMKDHSGMQGNEYITDEIQLELNRNAWLKARDNAISSVEYLGHGIHAGGNVSKQITNRLLEPFMWHKTLLSGTEWENFFALRAEGMAEIHLQALAYSILEEFNKSTSKLVPAGEWHVPFGDNINHRDLLDAMLSSKNTLSPNNVDECRLKVSTARCARTSYNNFDGTSDLSKDIVMCEERLIKPGHWSPLEHPNLSMNEEQFYNHAKEFTIPTSSLEEYESRNNKDWYEVVAESQSSKEVVIKEFGWCRNMRGWISYRTFFMNENRQEPRLIKR